MITLDLDVAAFAGLVDLAQEKLGGKAVIASDEFFAEKENLLKPGRGIFIPDKYTDRGKWMDGWETRRKRVPGHDWCIIQLGLAGILKGVDIDTNHFIGNYPAYASVDALSLSDPVADHVLAGPDLDWTEVVAKSALRPGSQNLFAVAHEGRWTHLRLNIYPDGGVARFRAYGQVVPDWSIFEPGDVVDLAAVNHGGRAVACNDMFFGSMHHLIMPGRGEHMGDAWETQRKRLPGHDWAVVELGRPGRVKKLEVDTAWHIGNYPDTCSVDACYYPDKRVDALNCSFLEWKELLPRTKLEADKQHYFEDELKDVGPVTHVRLNIYPDGGVARLRVYGTFHEQ